MVAVVFLAWSTLWAQPRKAAILLFDGVEIIDFTAPYEVFGQAGFQVFTVAEEKRLLTTAMNLKVTPDYDLQDAPQADILVIPGGRVPHQLPADDPKIRWVTAQSGRAEWVLSVCNGAFVLGAAGLLEGRRATTTAGMVDHLPMMVQGAIPVGNERVVQDGKFVTSGGLSAGIDGALFVVAQIHGQGRAQEIANNMEYNWDTSGQWVRGKLADLHLAQVMDFNPPLRNRQVLVYEGDENQWECRYLVRRTESLAEFYQQFSTMAASLYRTQWVRQVEEIQADQIVSEWEVRSPDGQRWVCKARFTAGASQGEIDFGFFIKKTL